MWDRSSSAQIAYRWNWSKKFWVRIWGDIPLHKWLLLWKGHVSSSAGKCRPHVNTIIQTNYRCFLEESLFWEFTLFCIHHKKLHVNPIGLTCRFLRLIYNSRTKHYSWMPPRLGIQTEPESQNAPPFGKTLQKVSFQKAFCPLNSSFIMEKRRSQRLCLAALPYH